MALAIGALAVPAAAATKGRLAVIQGRPGSATELCVNDNEVKSTFAYGAAWVKRMGSGQKVIKLRKKSSRVCGGDVLATKQLQLASGDDWVIVFTKLNPKVVTFAKATKPTSEGSIVLRNASDLGTLGFRYTAFDGGAQWFDFATIGTNDFTKGDGEIGGNQGTIYWAHRVPNTGVVGQPFSRPPAAGFYHDATVVGTNLGNARWVVLKLSLP
jgi:hypothetical protein